MCELGFFEPRINWGLERRRTYVLESATFSALFLRSSTLQTSGIYGVFMGLRVENAQEPMEEQNRIMGF